MSGQADTREHPSVNVTAPPFRADHVGSLLRTPELKAARETILGPHTAEANIGPHGNAALAAIEDQHVRDAIAMQKRAGLKVATDGELRRRSWMLELFLGWDGIGATRSGGGPIKWRNETGESQDMTEFRVDRPIQWRPSSIVQAFRFLKAETDLVAKVGLPSPCVVHYFLEKGGKLNPAVYKDQEAFWHDLIGAFQREIMALSMRARPTFRSTTSASPICAIRPIARMSSRAATIPIRSFGSTFRKSMKPSRLRPSM